MLRQKEKKKNHRELGEKILVCLMNLTLYLLLFSKPGVLSASPGQRAALLLCNTRGYF